MIRSLLDKSTIRATLLLVGLAAFVASAQAQSPLVAQLEIFQVDQQEIGGQFFEQLVEVRSVSPGTLLEYVLTYRNISDQLLAGFEVRSPIPANTFFLAGSDALTVDHQFQVSLDDGETWLDNPPMQSSFDEQGNEVQEEVPASAFTDLRWLIKSALAQQQQVSISYRVVLR